MRRRSLLVRRAVRECVDERLLDAVRAVEGEARQHAGVPAERDGNHRREHGDPEAAPDPFSCAERPLQCFEHAAADEDSKRQRDDRSQRVGKQQDRGLRARAAECGARQDQSEDRAGTGCPEKSHRNAEKSRLRYRRDGAVACGGDDAVPERDERTGERIRRAPRQQRDAEHGKHDERYDATCRIQLHGPAASDGRECRDPGERQGHAEEQRQRAAGERLVAARERKGQNRQHAGAQDREHAAQECQECQKHGFSPPRPECRLT